MLEPQLRLVKHIKTQLRRIANDDRATTLT